MDAVPPSKVYDPADVGYWTSSPVPPDSSFPAEYQMAEMLTLIDETPDEVLFVHQDNLELPEIPRAGGESVFENNETYTGVSASGPKGRELNEEWPDEEAGPEDFTKVKDWFQGLEQPTLADRVQYETAKLKESARKKQMKDRKAVEDYWTSENEEYFDTKKVEHDGPVARSNTTRISNRTIQTRSSTRIGRNPTIPSAEERKKSMQLGLEIALGKMNKRKGRRKGNKRTAKDYDHPAPKRKSKRKGPEQKSESLESILNTNFVEDANISSSFDAVPRFANSNKDTALAELVASLPYDDQKEAKSDKKKCIEASKNFSGKIKLDNTTDGWKLDGIKTILHHHQLLGASFMRERESCPRPPFGGLLCDIMGFGKTLQALANIAYERSTRNDDFGGSTLIVVPSHLVGHWRDQIYKHCDTEALGKEIVYDGNTRRVIKDTPDTFQTYNVVITSYEEVRRSYPQVQNMPDESDETKITEWWTKTFEEQAGTLHRIRWNRIILDEGHVIQNHLSQTSIAVRSLVGHFKWVVSGTPVQNYVHEFYPLFDFLGVPNIGSFGDFFNYFCQDDVGRDRLSNMLRSFMKRRNHSSRLFSLPVVKLPDIKEDIVETEFCAAERAIYDAILSSLLKNIKDLFIVENPNLAQHQCILARIQRLRMVCSHLLTVQALLKDLLSGPLMKALDEVVKKCEDWEAPSVRIINMLRGMTNGTFPIQHTQPSEDEEEITYNPELVRGFHKFMEVLHEEKQWEERLARTNCPRCNFTPVKPVITSCMHLYCEECYYLLGDNDKNESSSNRRRVCVKCHKDITAITTDVPVEDIDPKKPPRKKTKKETKKEAKRKAKADSQAEEKRSDWISVCAAQMPSAKLTKISELVAEWIRENPNVKVLIFTQFMDFVRILGIMCDTQRWPHAELTGKMSPRSRYESVEKFTKNEEIRVLIASLKAGGTGLNIAVASKCILVDLWWNEAVEDQALARIYRIGQENKVQFVKIVVKDTVDDRLLALQKWKTSQISATMGNEVLEKRPTITELLRIFGDAEETEDGLIRFMGQSEVSKGKQAVH